METSPAPDGPALPKILDLSVPIDPAAWEPDVVKRRYINHRQGADLLGQAFAYASKKGWLGRLRARLQQLLGLGIDHRDFPGGKGLSLMHYQLTTHTGTHMDAPFHYGDVDVKGRAARTICEVPLEWCLSDGIVLDLRGQRGAPQSGPVDELEVKAALRRIDYQLKPFDIVLLRTGGDEFLGRPEYVQRFRGVTRSATQYLVESGVKVIGIDSFGFDAPFLNMLTEYKRTGSPSCLWPAHLYGREREYCQLERLTNLGSLDRPHGFKVACFPVKLARADAAWCRVVAIL